jgi:hypothetical protein
METIVIKPIVHRGYASWRTYPHLHIAIIEVPAEQINLNKTIYSSFNTRSSSVADCRSLIPRLSTKSLVLLESILCPVCGKQPLRVIGNHRIWLVTFLNSCFIFVRQE